MIVKEFYRKRKDGVNLYRTYSDENLMIKKVGTDEVYEEAIDVEYAPYVYIETDIPIEVEGGGTITAVNEYEYDVPTNISYLTDTQGG